MHDNLQDGPYLRVVGSPSLFGLVLGRVVVLLVFRLGELVSQAKGKE